MRKLLIITAAALVLYACSSTSVVSSWKPDDVNTITLKKVLVVSMMGSKERDLRETTERAVSQVLINNGIQAVPSTSVLGPNVTSKINKDSIERELKANGYDGIMIVSLVNKEKNYTITPGYVGFPGPGWYGSYWGYYNTMYGMMYSPGYVTSSTEYGLEGNLYSLNPEKLIYSAQTKTYDPDNATELAKDFALSVMKDMQDKGLITAPAKK